MFWLCCVRLVFSTLMWQNTWQGQLNEGKVYCSPQFKCIIYDAGESMLAGEWSSLLDCIPFRKLLQLLCLKGASFQTKIRLKMVGCCTPQRWDHEVNLGKVNSLNFRRHIMKYHIFKIVHKAVLFPIQKSFWKMRLKRGEMNKIVNFENPIILD